MWKSHAAQTLRRIYIQTCTMYNFTSNIVLEYGRLQKRKMLFTWSKLPPFLLVILLQPFYTHLIETHSTTHRGCTWRKKHFPLNNLPPKMAATFQGLITNAGLMAAGMSYSYSSQKQTTSLYLYIWRHWNGGESRLNSCVSQFKTCNYKCVDEKLSCFRIPMVSERTVILLNWSG